MHRPAPFFFQYSLVFFSPPPHRINRKVKPDQTRCAELYPIYLFLMTLSLKGELRFSLFFLQKDWRSDLRFQMHQRYRSGDLNGATTKKKIFNWAADTISDLMAEFPLQQQQENTHTHTHIQVGEQWYWYGSGFPPCSTINHLKGSLLSGPFPPFPQSSLPHSGPFGPKDSNDSETSARKKKQKVLGCSMALQRAKRQMLHGGRTFSRKKTGFKFWQPRWVFFHSLVKPLMFRVFCGLHIGLTCRLLTWTPSYAKDMLSGLFLILNLNLQTPCVCTTFFYLLVFLLCIKMVYTLRSTFSQTSHQTFFYTLTLMTFSGNQL